MRRVVRTVEETTTEALFTLYDYKKTLSELFREDAHAEIFESLDTEVFGIGHYLDPMDLIAYQLLYLRPDIDITINIPDTEYITKRDGMRSIKVTSTPVTALMSTVLEGHIREAYGDASVQLPVNIAFDATKVRSAGRQTETPLYMHIDSLMEPKLSSLESYMMIGFLPTLSVRFFRKIFAIKSTTVYNSL
jgi:hypothetical protein